MHGVKISVIFHLYQENIFLEIFHFKGTIEILFIVHF